MPIRLGFPVRILGRPALSGAGAGPNAPRHLSVALIALRDCLVYLNQIGVRFYRIPADLLPPDPAAALVQLAECRAELDQLAHLVGEAGLRLGLHLDMSVTLAAADPQRVAQSLALIEGQAALLQRLESPGLRHTMVVHVAAPAADTGALQRFATHFAALSPAARARLAVEHDTAGFSLGALLYLHQLCGVAVVFDYLHWQLANPEGLALPLALGLALATWPAAVPAEVHLSSQRSEAQFLPARGGRPAHVLPPRPGQHADFIVGADLLHLLQAAAGLPPFDLMLEAKAGDLALLRLRADIQRLAPELAARLI